MLYMYIQVDALPWCEQGVLARETSLIQPSIQLINAGGFLTINRYKHSLLMYQGRIHYNLVSIARQEQM
jgi:hypothetical protein